MKPSTERKRLFDETECDQDHQENNPSTRNAIYSSFSSSKRLKLQQSLYRKTFLSSSYQLHDEVSKQDSDISQKTVPSKSTERPKNKATKMNVSKQKRREEVFRFKHGGSAKLKRKSTFCSTEQKPKLTPTQVMKYDDIQADRQEKSIFDEILEQDEKDNQEIATKQPPVSVTNVPPTASSSLLTATQTASKLLTRTKSVDLSSKSGFPKFDLNKSTVVENKITTAQPTSHTIAQVQFSTKPTLQASEVGTFNKPLNQTGQLGSSLVSSSIATTTVASVTATALNSSVSTLSSITTKPQNSLFPSVTATGTAPSFTGFATKTTSGSEVSISTSKPPGVNFGLSTVGSSKPASTFQFGTNSSEKQNLSTGVITTLPVDVAKQGSSIKLGNVGKAPAFGSTSANKQTTNATTNAGDHVDSSKQVVTFSFGNKSEETTEFKNNLNQPTQPSALKPVFNFGTTKSEVIQQMSVAPFSQNLITSSQSQVTQSGPTFSFNTGQSSSSSSNQFGFGTSNTKQNSLPASNPASFSFGGAGSNSQQSSSASGLMFNFGATQPKQPQSASTSFKFGATNQPGSSSSSTFSFGGSSATQPNPPSQNNPTPFGFGGTLQQTGSGSAFNFAPSAQNQPAKSFGFGNSQPNPPIPAPASLNFGSQNQSTPQQKTSAFQFGAGNKSTQGGFNFGGQSQTSASPAPTGNLRLLQSGNPPASSTPFKFPNPSTGSGPNTSFSTPQQNNIPGGFNLGPSAASPATKRIRAKPVRRRK
uniref:Nucleoporin NUP152-like n=1 Tax=Phallusia mammillata TaxID=59560 RepID=A0A6F9DM54_9ASCI|nr:nucleoporin NUP152-like [Phallusia mammillata]